MASHSLILSPALLSGKTEPFYVRMMGALFGRLKIAALHPSSLAFLSPMRTTALPWVSREPCCAQPTEETAGRLRTARRRHFSLPCPLQMRASVSSLARREPFCAPKTAALLG